MKIKSLQFYDYRVFYAEKESDKQDYFVEVDSKNLLIYGENGSGKTSFFLGLKDIVHQEDFTSHFKTPILNDGYLEITFDDNSTDKFDASAANATSLELLNISKLNSFLSYRELLRTHFFDDSEINFFEIIVNDILKEHNLITLGQLQAAWKSLKARDIEKEKIDIHNSVPEEISEDEAREQIEILELDYDEQITIFNDEFDELLESINAGIDETVKYFNQGISVRFELETLTREDLSSPVLYAKVEYGDFNLMSHHKFLNEARLSAIAISAYLTALQTNPTIGAIKFIFLDDIFLGLDLNNRLPLLDILKEQFSEWQIFLTTYDRHWFEVAKQHLETSKWKAIEMYATTVEGKSFEKPIIIQSEDYYEKANKYFKAGDYPAALNYLRKELERQIKDRLPEEELRNFDSSAPKQLSSLWDVMLKRYDRNGNSALISQKLRDDLKIVKLSLLHPHSHDSLSTPVYKYELIQAFNIIRQIQSIPIIRWVTLLSSGMELIFLHPHKPYRIKFRIEEDWTIDVINGLKNHRYPKCRLIEWEYNAIKFWHMLQNRVMDAEEIEKHHKIAKTALQKLNKQIEYHIANGLLSPLSEEEFLANTSIDSHLTLKDLLDKCDNYKSDSWLYRVFRKQ